MRRPIAGRGRACCPYRDLGHAPAVGHCGRRGRCGRAVVPSADNSRFDIGNVEKAVAADAEVDERGLNARFDVDDAALVDVADVVLVAGAFDVEFFQDAVFEDGDAALFGLGTLMSISFFMRTLPRMKEKKTTPRPLVGAGTVPGRRRLRVNQKGRVRRAPLRAGPCRPD